MSRNFTTLAKLGCFHNGSCNCILEMVTFAKVCARKMFLSFVRAYVTILSVGGREAGRQGGWEAGRLQPSVEKKPISFGLLFQKEH